MLFLYLWEIKLIWFDLNFDEDDYIIKMGRYINKSFAHQKAWHSHWSHDYICLDVDFLIYNFLWNLKYVESLQDNQHDCEELFIIMIFFLCHLTSNFLSSSVCPVHSDDTGGGSVCLLCSHVYRITQNESLSSRTRGKWIWLIVA